MKLERILKTLAAIAGVLIVIAAISWAVAALDSVWPVLAVVAAIVLALAASSLLKRRVPQGTVIEIDLDSGVVETKGSDPIARAMTRGAVTVRDVVDALDRAAQDPRVSGLIVRLGNGGINIGHAQELREAVHRFRQAQKKTVAFAEAFGEAGPATVDYYLASAFETVYLQPLGQASIQGLVATSPFLRGVFDRFGLVPDFEHRKEYKAAKYLFTETEFTEPHREALDGVSRDLFSQITDGIARDRELEQHEVERLIDSAPLTAEEALTAGLIDQVGYRDEAYEAAGKPSKYLFHDKYLKKAGRPHRRGKRMALIYGTGSIARGSSRFDPLTRGSSLGADDVADAFRKAIDNDKVSAIVFRVDSPGGSAVASEVVGHEVARAREEGKPVVVSMGNVAGSGGYWVATGADKIVALPGTITGSIGVVSGKLADREAWARLGVTFDEIPFGENSTFGHSRDVYTDSERRRLQVVIDDIYDKFVGLVATGRDLAVEQVEQVARGRIWTGAQALEHGLIDSLGGLDRAIELAKEAAGIDPDDGVRLMVLPRERPVPLPESNEGSDPIRLITAVIDLVANWRGSVGGVQARMPWLRMR